MSTPKLLLATLGALAAGVVIGMLIAPEKGSAMRKNLLKKGDDLVDSMGDKIEGKFNEMLHGISRVTRKKEGEVVANQKEIV
jgi:gas vesicle protein